jgi:hypothetical protein
MSYRYDRTFGLRALIGAVESELHGRRRAARQPHAIEKRTD